MTTENTPSVNDIQSGFFVAGQWFKTKAEATEFVRKPKVMAALAELTKGNQEVSDYLYNNIEGIEAAFEVAKIRRVTKAEHAKLKKALEAIVAANDPAAAFVAENSAAILESFRWPSVKRMSEEEATVAQTNALNALTGDNVELAQWILANKTQLLEAFQAGIEKRQLAPAAAAGLEAYREKRRLAKLALEGAAAGEAPTGTDNA